MTEEQDIIFSVHRFSSWICEFIQQLICLNVCLSECITFLLVFFFLYSLVDKCSLDSCVSHYAVSVSVIWLSLGHQPIKLTMSSFAPHFSCLFEWEYETRRLPSQNKIKKEAEENSTFNLIWHILIAWNQNIGDDQAFPIRILLTFFFFFNSCFEHCFTCTFAYTAHRAQPSSVAICRFQSELWGILLFFLHSIQYIIQFQ